MKAINTLYDGHHFRSRLEARWAVVFNMLGITWKYENEGYKWIDEGRELWYLPDFYLPEKRCFAEIKGQLTIHDIRALASAITHMQSLRVYRILILGDMPAKGFEPSGIMLSWQQEQVVWHIWDDDHWWRLAAPLKYDTESIVNTFKLLQRSVIANGRSLAALAGSAGRQARFEHGETPISTHDIGRAIASRLD